MTSDLEIARAASPLPIEEVAAKLGLDRSDLIIKGDGMAKVRMEALTARNKTAPGFLVLVTSVNPTPLGEGKTVTTIGLAQALNRLNRNAVCVIREPSMGPVFGLKGGAAGGGHSQVLPMEAINLHFTGDMHAVTSAHNLLSALIDNHLHHGNARNLEPRRIFWPRVVDLNDRALRNTIVGLGGAHNGVTREDRTDITAASEVMAILALSKNWADLRRRLGAIVVGMDSQDEPVTAEDIGAAGSMALLLRDALLPNLVQTIEGDPAFVHCGPFANIAHGNSSIIADEVALRCAEFVVTEAGFGSDMGAEKAMHIKAPAAGRPPDCVVVNVTVRSMKLHGGGFSTGAGKRPDPAEVAIPNVQAVRTGCANLRRHVANMRAFGLPVIVSINRFESDSADELQVVMQEALGAGAAAAVITEVHAKGGDGGRDLARAVAAACEDHMVDGRPFEPLVPDDAPVRLRLETIATKVYGAKGLALMPKAERMLERFEEWGYGWLPVCMAKTQYSFSADPALLGAPSDFILPIREFRLNGGAGFITALCGEMMTMPGLPARAAAYDMDMDGDGRILGVFG